MAWQMHNATMAKTWPGHANNYIAITQTMPWTTRGKALLLFIEDVADLVARRDVGQHGLRGAGARRTKG